MSNALGPLRVALPSMPSALKGCAYLEQTRNWELTVWDFSIRLVGAVRAHSDLVVDRAVPQNLAIAAAAVVPSVRRTVQVKDIHGYERAASRLVRLKVSLCYVCQRQAFEEAVNTSQCEPV